MQIALFAKLEAVLLAPIEDIHAARLHLDSRFVLLCRLVRDLLRACAAAGSSVRISRRGLLLLSPLSTRSERVEPMAVAVVGNRGERRNAAPGKPDRGGSLPG